MIEPLRKHCTYGPLYSREVADALDSAEIALRQGYGPQLAHSFVCRAQNFAGRISPC